MPQKTLTFFRFLKAFAQWEISFSLALWYLLAWAAAIHSEFRDSAFPGENLTWQNLGVKWNLGRIPAWEILRVLLMSLRISWSHRFQILLNLFSLQASQPRISEGFYFFFSDWLRLWPRSESALRHQILLRKSQTEPAAASEWIVHMIQIYSISLKRIDLSLQYGHIFHLSLQKSFSKFRIS
jgi:hypothetical protein